VALGLTQSLT